MILGEGDVTKGTSQACLGNFFFYAALIQVFVEHVATRVIFQTLLSEIIGINTDKEAIIQIFNQIFPVVILEKFSPRWDVKIGMHKTYTSTFKIVPSVLTASGTSGGHVRMLEPEQLTSAAKKWPNLVAF